MKFLIAGLGNIGDEYAHTRHNIGFDVVMAFVQKHGATLQTDRLAFKAEVRWKGRTFVCICPTTYMNLSGKALAGSAGRLGRGARLSNCSAVFIASSA